MGRTGRILTVVIVLAGLAGWHPARPAEAAVGDGTPASCDEDALDTALSDGGPVAFNCGPNPVTIWLTDQKDIALNTQIDGGGLVTLDGQGSTRIFRVSAGIKLDLTGITLANGRVAGDFGGALYNGGGTVTIANSTLHGNRADLAAGALYNSSSGSVTLIASTLSENAAQFGGGIYNDSGGSVTLAASTLSSNSATFSGGGLYNSLDGNVTLTNSTLSGNLATFSGGALLNDRGTLTLISSTLSGNSADFGGGILNNGPISLQNTIVANSASPSGFGGNCVNLFDASQGGNLSDDTSCFFNQPGDLPNTEDGLGPLQDNGGPTQTHLPEPDSAAIDSGHYAGCAAKDQRGSARPQGTGCDIGAVEVRQGATYALCASIYSSALTSPLYGDCEAGTIPLTVPGVHSFCINAWTGQLTYAFGQPCAPPRWTHAMPDNGDLLTCVRPQSGLNRWVASHSQCLAAELPNTIPATP